MEWRKNAFFRLFSSYGDLLNVLNFSSLFFDALKNFNFPKLWLLTLSFLRVDDECVFYVLQ